MKRQLVWLAPHFFYLWISVRLMPYIHRWNYASRKLHLHWTSSCCRHRVQILMSGDPDFLLQISASWNTNRSTSTLLNCTAEPPHQTFRLFWDISTYLCKKVWHQNNVCGSNGAVLGFTDEFCDKTNNVDQI